MFIVSSCFIRRFKIGDNINHNLETLRLLYALSDEDSKKRVPLRKPIILILVSVAEAMLYDFLVRIQSSEHMATLPAETVEVLQTKKYSQLNHFIAIARSHDLLSAGDELYDQLDKLRKLRNRIHIQNEKNHFEQDERVAFRFQRQREAESVLENIAKSLALYHPRKTTTHGFVADFEFPWDEHWDFGDG